MLRRVARTAREIALRSRAMRTPPRCSVPRPTTLNREPGWCQWDSGGCASDRDVRRDPWTFGTTPVRAYDVFPDGSFVIAPPDEAARILREETRPTELHVILNWFEELEARVGR